MRLMYILSAIFVFFTNFGCSEAKKNTQNVIRSGVPWFDNKGNIVNAHGACIVEDGGRYYLFGEWKSDGSNAFPGFSCYSSCDLVNWKFENVVLPMQKDGILGPNRVGERVKVMKCPTTGEYVMYMHADDMKYMDPYIGYATCNTISGDYEFHGPLLCDGEVIRRWDMGTFQDTDGTGYLLIHHGLIYRLNKDYRSAEALILNGLKDSGESPAMFKKNGLYYMLYSGLTSWEKNDNFYFTAPAVEGPWTKQGLFVPEGLLTYNSQTTFVFPLIRNNDTIPMFMGDRWSFPHQASAATYVWQPMQVDGEKLHIPEYWAAWDIDKIKPVDPLGNSTIISAKRICFSRDADWQNVDKVFKSNTKDSYMEVTFTGTQIAIVGQTNSQSGYAQVTLFDDEDNIKVSSLVDFYSKKDDDGIRYLSPVQPQGKYTLRVEVTGIIPEWFQKNGNRFGSSDCYVNVSKFILLKN